MRYKRGVLNKQGKWDTPRSAEKSTPEAMNQLLTRQSIAFNIPPKIAKKLQAGIVFVHAHWCPHCVQAMPELQKIARTSGFNVWFVESKDTDLEVRDCLPYVSKHNEKVITQ